MSSPTSLMWRPGVTGSVTRTRPSSTRVSSAGTTAVALAGTGAPVMMRMQVPASTSDAAGLAGRLSPCTSNGRGSWVVAPNVSSGENRVAVHRGTPERGHVRGGGDLARDDPAARLHEVDQLAVERADALVDQARRLVDCGTARETAHPDVVSHFEYRPRWWKVSRCSPWYRQAARDLPWRRTTDPYAIWVSEIMLQQTRVAAVIPFFERFMARFPDVGALARAREATVLSLWSGLGYYRRARMLHAAARIVAREGMPQSAQALRALPGIGDYTAAAIASIAFGERAPVVDGNVERVVARHTAADCTKREARAWMEARIPDDAPADFNQAVMELGATVCTPRSPKCGACPIAGTCRGRSDPERYPTPKKRAAIRVESKAVKLASRGGEVFLRRIEGSNVLDGMWDLPPSRGGGPVLGEVTHGILHRRYRISIHRGRATGAGRWFTPAQLARVPLATAARKCLRKVGVIR